MNDLDLAFNEIRNKRAGLDTLFSYVDGPQPLKYSTERLAEAFENINTHFEINWCSVVVDATLDRVQLKGFDTKDEVSNARMALLFDRLHLDIEADRAHYAALSTSQAYLIIWKNADGEIEAYYNDPRLCAVFYDPASPRKKLFAAKWFNHSDGMQEITLYYPERLEHWISTKVQTGTAIDKSSAFTLQTTETNPYGVIPMFELRTAGEIYKILTDQDAVNKLFSDMMVTSDVSSAPMRYAISNSDPGNIKNGPNIWAWFPAGDGQGQAASVGQFPVADLSGYWVSMDNLANAIAIITRTPKHYFSMSGSNVSGEALLAMESPLVKKCKKRQREFGSQWQDIAAFMLQLEGVTIEPSQIFVVWERSESVQPKTEAEIRQLGVNTGVPLITLLRREGWGQDEIDAMLDDKKLQDKAEKTMAQALLNDLRIKQQQWNPQDVEQDNSDNANNTG